MTTRGLEPAGVDLQARNFRQYIDRLGQIDKTQRRIFGSQPKGLNQSFTKARRSAKQFEDQINKTTRAQQQFGNALGAIGVTIGLRETIRFAQESINLAREQAKTEAQLEAGIRSTGAAAGLGSNELRQLASELQGLTNFGDEATIQMQALLLTFTNIRENEFRRTVPLVQDLATRMGTDLNSAAVQVGKALNAPTKNLDGLSRAGIQFSDAQKQVIADMVEANNIAGAQAIILDELQRQFGGSAQAAREADGGITALGNSFGDLQEQIGNLLLDLDKSAGFTKSLTNEIDILTGSIKGIRFDLGLSDDILDQIASTEAQLNDLKMRRDELVEGGGLGEKILESIGLGSLTEKRVQTITEQIIAYEEELKRLQGLAAAEDAEEVADAQDKVKDAVDNTNDSLKEQEAIVKALQSAVRQAEQLELSFARAAEDAARRLARQQAKLARDQFKDRVDLLNDQAKEFDQFQEDELEDVQDAEAELAEAREKAGKERLREQDKLHRELKQARDRFNLDAIQSQRRFDLQDRRLRAAGDILALQELREDFALQQQEAKENFNLQNKQRKEDTKDQTETADERRQEQVQELEQELTDLQNGLDQRRTEFLAAQQEEFNSLLAAQAEQRLAARQAQLEQEEDRRISQQRQIEDLGRSLAEQEDLTKEGAAKIAEQLEEAFGIEGIADQIMGGFTTRQESAFQELFESISEDAKIATEELEGLKELTRDIGGGPSLEFGAGGANPATFGIPSFHQGGVVGGPRGSEQFAQVLGGETILPTHQMNAPLIPSQTLNVNMSGGFNISGGEGVSARVKQEAISEMTEAFEIAVRRLGRRV